jgi:hypothetical protein
MNTAFNRISETQQNALQDLRRNQIRFLAAGEFAIDAYDQSRLDPKLTLLIDPEPKNREKFEALKTDPLRKFNLDSDQIRFKMASDAEFEHLYRNSVEYPAIRRHLPNQVEYVRHVGIADLYKKTAKVFSGTGSTFLDYVQHNLSVLFEASKVFPVKDVKLPNPNWLKEGKLTLEEAFAEANSGPKHVRFPNQSRMEDNNSYNPVSRDLKELRNTLDIEIVLRHYGYKSSSRNKGNVNETYRIYKPDVADSTQRIVVMNRADLPYKGFVDLNNNSFKGDSIEFVKTMEQGDWKRTFETIDRLLGNPEYPKWKQSIAELRPTSRQSYLNDEKIIQSELIRHYKATFVSTDQHLEYLRSRALDKSTILAPEFVTQIISVVTTSTKDPEQSFQNVAFPLVSSTGNMISMDIRSKGYKAFPEGEKGDALWTSNPKVEIGKDTTFRNLNNDTVVLSKGTHGFLTKAGFAAFDQKSGESIILSFEKGATFKPVKPTSIIISESPIDALSFHQLNPPAPGENRLYLSTAGSPSQLQQNHISEIIGKNPEAQVVLAHDADNPGIRFSVNTIALDQKSLVKPDLSFFQNVGTDGQKEGFNLLTLRFEGTVPTKQVSSKLLEASNEAFSKRVTGFLDRLNSQQIGGKVLQIEATPEQTVSVNPKFPVESIVSSAFKIRLGNETKQLANVLDGVVALANELYKGNRFVVVLPSLAQKDFNNELKERAGKAFDLASPLRFNGEQHVHQTQQAKSEQIKPSNKPRPS